MSVKSLTELVTPEELKSLMMASTKEVPEYKDTAAIVERLQAYIQVLVGCGYSENDCGATISVLHCIEIILNRKAAAKVQ